MLQLNQYTHHLGRYSETDRANQMKVVMMMFKKFQLVVHDLGKKAFLILLCNNKAKHSHPSDLCQYPNGKREKSQSIVVRKNLNVRSVDLDPDPGQVVEIESIKSDHRQRNGVERTETTETWILSLLLNLCTKRKLGNFDYSISNNILNNK